MSTRKALGPDGAWHIATDITQVPCCQNGTPGGERPDEVRAIRSATSKLAP